MGNGPDRAALRAQLARVLRELTPGWDGHVALARFRPYLDDVVPALVTFVGDPDPVVRRVAPYALCVILADPIARSDAAGPIRARAAVEPIRARAVVEDDPMALAGQLRALDELGSTPRSWFAPWLRHPAAEVRIAAVAALAVREGREDGEPGLGTVAAEALTSAWQRLRYDSPGKAPAPWAAVKWAADRLAARPDEGARFALALFAHRDSEMRFAATDAAAAVLNRWRLPMEPLWTAIAAGLTDPTVRYRSTEILVTAGAAARPHTDALLDAVERDDSTIRTHAALTLAALGDRRAVPALSHWIATSPFWPQGRVAELIAPLRDHAAELLPVIRVALRRSDVTTGQFLDLLAAWGPAGADAIPELVDLLDHPEHALRSCIVLGRIGPPAHLAADALEHLAAARRRPPTRYPGLALRWPGRQHAAWAHWRITGVADAALSVLGPAVRRGSGHAMLPYLADLGPLAAEHAEPVRRLLDGPGGWTRVEAAHAWWRITGDPVPAVPVLVEAVEPLRERRFSPLVRAAVRHLGTIGRPAEAARPCLEAALTGDRRHHDPRTRQPIRDDDALVREARAALDRIGSMIG